MEYNMQNVYRRIKVIMHINKKSVQDLVDNCNIGSSFLSQLKRGTVINIAALGRIADYLNVSTDFLLGRTNVPNSHLLDGEELKL